ncbi:MAG: alpha-xylosidase [Clostridia bacterium]|nr:alpha-xylosidase [Clostridia bacterium]
MKFTHGYWVLRENFTLNYAQQWVRTDVKGDSLHIKSACHPIRSRGEGVGGAALDITFTAPRPNIIRVKITHFKGMKEPCPRFETYEQPVQPVIAEDEKQVIFQSGELRAEIQKPAGGEWQVAFYGGDRLLTTSGYRSMGHAWERNTRETFMIESLMLDVGECVYGLGERFGAYVKNGQSIDMWNADGGTASDLAYKNIPFYMTNRGYGVFVENTSDVSFEVASEKVERVQFSVSGETLTYDIIYGGTPKKTIDLYTALTGRPALVPAWSFGLWLSTSFTTNYDENTVTSFIDGMTQRDIPLSVFHFDCFWMKNFNWCDFTWDPDTFPDPEGMLRRYHDRGLRLCCWINPYIAQASPLFDEGMEHGYLIRKTNGDVWQTDMWQTGMGIVDVTNPDARKWYCDHLRRLMDMGVDCFKTDFGERIPVRDIAYFDGSDPLYMHNYYSYLYNRMVFETIREKRGEGDAIVFARSATAGGQQFPVHWGGDNSATYISMAETLRGGLGLSHCGFGYWSHDISGFEQTAPADVYKRWCAFGLLSSHSRLHGSVSYRVPWLFDEESCDVLRKFVRLKCRLMPYLYACAVEAHEHGTPMARPMMMEFPNDPGCDMLDRQYMLGENLLVAPVFTKAGDVSFYAPEGMWTNILDGHTVSCGWHKEVHDFMSMPLMAREGCVIPMGACDSHPDYDYLDGLELHVYALAEGKSASCTVYDLNGKPAACFTITMKNGKSEVITDSQKPYTVVLH